MRNVKSRLVARVSLLSTIMMGAMLSGMASAAINVTASGDDGHVPRNTIDGVISPESRWSEQGDGAWIKYDYGTSQNVTGLKIAFHDGDKRTTSFDVQVSNDNSKWQTIFSGKSQEKTLALQKIAINGPVQARYLRIVGHGNSINDWNSITEVVADLSSGSSSSSSSSSSQGSTGNLEKELLKVFELEGDSPFRANNVLVFSALESKWVTGNGHGWRNELKIKDSERKDMSQTYETFSATLKVNLSKGAKTIVSQYHEADTGTLMKLYIADTAEKVFSDSKANDGVFDVFVRMTGTDGKETRHALGTIKSGDTFNLTMTNNYGDIVVTALGQSVSKRIKDSKDVFFKFGDYLQAQDPVTGKDYKPAEFAQFYKDQGITVDQITYTNVKHTRN